MRKNLNFLMYISFNFERVLFSGYIFLYCEIVYFKEYFIGGFLEMISQHLLGKEDLWKVKVTLTASVIY